MAAPPVTGPPKGRPFLRFGFPCAVLALAAVGVAAVWAWPSAEWERANRVVCTGAAVMLAALLLAVWLVFFSGLRRSLGLAILLAVALVVLASVRSVSFTGDMVPLVSFRWSPTQDDILEAYRQQQPDTPVPGPVETSSGGGTDFPEYRGRGRDGVVTGPPLARDWQARPPRLVWRHPVGGGYSAFAVAGNIAVTLEQRRSQEAVVCYDTATGNERWQYAYPAYFTESLGGPGPRATPTVTGDDVFSLGAAGMLVCLDARTGKPRWSVNILDGNENVSWGMSGSPLVFDRVVVVNPGTQKESARGRAVVAYDRATGKEAWAAGSARAGYSSPMLATLCGRRQVVLLDGEGLAGYDPEAHRELWRFPWETQQGINVAQPLVVDGNRVFISSGYGVGCAMLKVSEERGKWSVTPLWRNLFMRCKFTSPVAAKGFLYGLDEGILVCLDQDSGTRRWKGGRYGHGQLLLADDLLLILSESGSLVLVEANPEAPRELGRLPVFDHKTWNCPALAGGRAFLRNDREMACYELREPK